MNTFGRFIMTFALLGLVGAGCFANQEVVVNMDDDMDTPAQLDENDSDAEEVEIEEGTYSVNEEASIVTWVGRKTGGQHNGTIDIADGSLTVGESASGEVVIDMTTIVDLDLEDEEMNEQLVTHLKSDDFFAVETYPTAMFTVTQLESMGGDENIQVTGMFTMKDITNEVTFPAQLVETENGYQLKAQFELDRSKWDVRFGSQTLLGDAINILIDDMITIGLDIVLVSADQTAE